MKVIVTLDYWDGSRSRSKVVYLDQLDTTFLKLKLTEEGVASVTITNATKLGKIADMTEGS